MLQGWLREDGQAVVELEVACRDGSSRTVPAIIDTGFNGQVSLSRRIVNELDLQLTYEGTVEVELANGAVVEEDIYSGKVRFDGQATRQKGLMRTFTTPPLSGPASYQVTATWQQDGQPITRERTVSVRPGATVTVDFTLP